MRFPRFVGLCRSTVMVAATVALCSLPAVSVPTSQTRVAPAAAAATTSDACGPLLRKSTGGYWSCTLVDHFNGTSLNPYRWGVTRTADNGFTSGGECFVSSPANVKVEDGLLRLTARRLSRPTTCSSPRDAFTTSYTGGMVSSWARFAQAYGRFEVRARFPAAKVPGLHSALWLYPANPNKYGAWPASGEIDIAEFYTMYPARVVPYVHYDGDKLDPNATSNKCVVYYPERFHTYVVEWTPIAITVLYDGKVCIRDEWQPAGGLVKPQPFDQPFTVNLTQAIGLGGNRPTSSTPMPGSMYVDRVRIWR